MKIEFTPDFLNKYNKDIIDCPSCNNKLVKNIFTEKSKIKECEQCLFWDRYTDRPFGWYGRRHCDYECSCKYEEYDILKIECLNCINIEFKKKLKKEKEEQINKWVKLTPQEKLEQYGIIKLKLLCKKKNIKGYSKLKKDEIIKLLSPIIDQNDFPIK